MSLNETPSANRIHIGFYGKRNSGKSSLINAFTGQQVAIVSDVAGTTTDPVYKPMEVHGIGPCVFIDTAGVDDVGELGKMRVEKTEKAAKAPEEPAWGGKSAFLTEMEIAMSMEMGRKVRIIPNGEGGTLQIQFWDEEDLKSLAEKFAKY